MIYKILAENMHLVFKRGENSIATSGDGMYGLVKNLTDTTDITIISQHDDSELDTLLSQPEWRQPCNNC